MSQASFYGEFEEATMPNENHYRRLKKDVDKWNKWREAHFEIDPDLSGCDLSSTDLSKANLDGADLSYATLSHADLSNATLVEANLIYANLNGADLSGADLRRANLSDAILSSTNLSYVNFEGANASGADLSQTKLDRAVLSRVNLSRANLSEANFDGAVLIGATFGDNDLSVVKGLDRARHYGPSTIGIDTLYKSAGNIPELFLVGCGIPETFIPFIDSHLGAQQAIQFYSCFISYSHENEDFAQRLHSRLRDSEIRVWYAPEEVKGGRKLHEQIYQAIQVHDKLLLVLSEHSLKSEWVMTEIRSARKTELAEKRRKLFPIRLVDFETIKKWECFDAGTGKDLAIEVREYFIPDFSEWKKHDAFEIAFNRLLNDLRPDDTTPDVLSRAELFRRLRR